MTKKVFLMLFFLSFMWSGGTYAEPIFYTQVEYGPTIQPNFSISFSGEDRPVGIIYWKDGTFVFKGNAEESARVFFDYYLKNLVDDYILKNCGEIEP